MSAVKLFAAICRFPVESPDAFRAWLGHAGGLVPTRRRSYLAPSVGGVLHVLPDVSGGDLDVLVCDLPASWSRAVWLCEVGRKVGKYDGVERIRITLRPVQSLAGCGLAGVDVHELTVTATFDEVRISAGLYWSGTTFRRLRAELDTDRLGRIIGWHARRYFPHLTMEAIMDAESMFLAELGPRVEAGEACLLAEANRLAERLLYRASVDAGWRKLTPRERERLGIDGGHWQREERVVAARNARRAGDLTGCGEATIGAARGYADVVRRGWTEPTYDGLDA